ncbi:MAG TPA: hypothetical protein VK324_06740 [Tepidisphaeraceae bacterium]|nr:hypothetical protein [Tepidisphaeraceae bacterium]
MDAFKISAKLFAAADTFEPAAFVPVFHKWIQQHALPDHLLIDVADYAHVPAGPGSLVVAHEANVHMDRTDGRLGVLYVRKQPFAAAATFRDRLRQTIVNTLVAADRLEQDVPGLRFRTDEVWVRVHDRLHAPPGTGTFNAVRADVESVAKELFVGRPVTLAPEQDPRRLFGVTIKADGEPTTVAALLERLGATATA